MKYTLNFELKLAMQVALSVQHRLQKVKDKFCNTCFNCRLPINFYSASECEPPTTSAIENGRILIDAGSYSVGTVLAYLCNDGFASRDISETECQDTSFTWTLDSDPPICRRSKLLLLCCKHWNVLLFLLAILNYCKLLQSVPKGSFVRLFTFKW